jgi:hypothetical protein
MKSIFSNKIIGAGVFKFFTINKKFKSNFMIQNKKRKKKGGVKLNKTLKKIKTSSITLTLSDILELNEIEKQKKEIEQKLIELTFEIQREQHIGIFVKITRFIRKILLYFILFLLKRLERKIKK